VKLQIGRADCGSHKKNLPWRAIRKATAREFNQRFWACPGNGAVRRRRWPVVRIKLSWRPRHTSRSLRALPLGPGRAIRRRRTRNSRPSSLKTSSGNWWEAPAHAL